MLILRPNDLDEPGARRLELISDNKEPHPLIGRLWRAIKDSTGGGNYNEKITPPRYVSKRRNACRLAAAVAADSASESEPAQPSSLLVSVQGPNEQECINIGPRAGLRKFSGEGGSAELNSQFSGTWGQASPAKRL